MKVSIVTPIWLSDNEKDRRLPLFEKCVASVAQQDYDLSDIEHIVIDDGSPVALPDFGHHWLRVSRQANLQRLVATNRGLEEARGDIICFLDSDDEYEPDYVSTVVSYFTEYPEYKMFNFGATMVYSDGGIEKREAFKPEMLKTGHEVFGGGKIINGTFVFHRSVYEKLGGFPSLIEKDIDCTEVNYGGVRDLTMLSPYDFSAYAQVEFPEMRKYFMVNHIDEPHKIIQELGNPWGNDYYLFYKYTRFHHSKPMDDFLLRVNLKV